MWDPGGHFRTFVLRTFSSSKLGGDVESGRSNCEPVDGFTLIAEVVSGSDLELHEKNYIPNRMSNDFTLALCDHLVISGLVVHCICESLPPGPLFSSARQ